MPMLCYLLGYIPVNTDSIHSFSEEVTSGKYVQIILGVFVNFGIMLVLDNTEGKS